MARKPRRRSPGEGSVYKRPDRGTWVAALIVGYYPDGSIKRRTKTFDIRLDAQAWLTEQQAALQDGVRLSENPTFAEVYDDWMANGRDLRRWADSTVAAYEAAIKQVLPALGGRLVRELTGSDIERALRGLARGGTTAAGLKRVHSHVGMVMRRAERLRIINRNPAQDVDTPTAPEPQIERWSEAEVGRVLRTCLELDTEVARYTIVALGTGMRIEELLGLAWASVNLDEREITVERVATEVGGRVRLRDSGKTDAAFRVVTVDDRTVAALRRQQERVRTLMAVRPHLDARMARRGLNEPLGWADLDLVFPTAHGTPWGRTVLRRNFDALQTAAGVTRIRLYATRSTHGSLLADAGVNLHAIAERLGHTDPRFTAKTYLRGSSSTHHEVANRLGAILGSSLVAAERDSSGSEVLKGASASVAEAEKPRPEAIN